MSVVGKCKKILPAVLKPSLITGRSRYLFILSHMRSRSSVLSHVLGSNEEIVGYSELHSSYLGYKDVLRMRLDLYSDLGADLQDKYLLDKLLRNRYEISKSVSDKLNPKIIFLLRDAESTMKSIVNMGNITGISWYKDPQLVLDYYCSRLRRLEVLSLEIGGGCFFIDSDALVRDTDVVLKELTEWLELEVPLASDYKLFNNSGKPGYGDPSNHIKSGVLKETKGHSMISIPDDILSVGQKAYEQCKASLLLRSN